MRPLRVGLEEYSASHFPNKTPRIARMTRIVHDLC